MGSFALRLGGLGLEVGVLARVEVEELGVCEDGQVVLEVQVAVFHGIRLRADSVEVAKVLRHVGAVPTAVIRHDEYSSTGVRRDSSIGFVYRSQRLARSWRLLRLRNVSIQLNGQENASYWRSLNATSIASKMNDVDDA